MYFLFCFIGLFDTTDLINDDFDSKYSLKIKSAGPCNSVSLNLDFHSIIAAYLHSYSDNYNKLFV